MINRPDDEPYEYDGYTLPDPPEEETDETRAELARKMAEFKILAERIRKEAKARMEANQ